MRVNDGYSLHGYPSAETMLLRWELDYGLSMAELALANLLFGSPGDCDRWKAHALDALTSAASTAARLDFLDMATDHQLHELAHRLSLL